MPGQLPHEADSFQSNMQAFPDDDSTHSQIEPQAAWLSRLAQSPDFNRVICLGLLVATFAVYLQVAGFDFIQIDDPQQVSANPHVQAGFTADGIRWAFRSVVASNWMPITLLSHMMDCELFGIASGKHHLTNVVLHAISAVLLFLIFRRATQTRWPSAFVAFVFALHPLHVESAAWIAERKDVLSTLFWFLALYAYVYYSERPSTRRYLVVMALFSLGLMSKPMLVTFPFTLLLFDLCPLRRFDSLRILWEKLPMFSLAALIATVTYFVQRSSGAFSLPVPLTARLENALQSYVIYIGQMFWPARLAAIYTFPEKISTISVLAAAVIILTISALVIANLRQRPYYAVGWFWYLGTLVPVIGLVQVGFQSHADRYMYIPMIGLSIALAWGAADAVERWPAIRTTVAPVFALSCLSCMVLAFQQTSYWRNTETLYQHAVDVTSDNWMAEGYLGSYLMKRPGRRAEAVQHLEAALRIHPDTSATHNNLGLCMLDAGLYDAALTHFQTAMRLEPGTAAPLNNAGLSLMRKGDYAGAIPYLTAALRAEPDAMEIHEHLGIAFSMVPGRDSEAISNFEQAIRLNPGFADARYRLGLLFAKTGRIQDAISQLEAAQQIQQSPEISEALEKLRLSRPH